MKYILLLLAIPYFNNTCSKAKNSLPPCIQQKIEEIKKQPKWNPAAEVHEYIYNGKTTYLFSSNCCDQYNMLYDANCTALCAPSGGFTGKGDNKCSDFNEKATHVRLVWKDSR